MLKISNSIIIPDNELEWKFVRAQGAGGQHVNKTSTAVQLRFSFLTSTALSDFHKKRLLTAHDQRICKEGFIIIKAQKYRSQIMNRQEAKHRLRSLINAVIVTRKKRQPTTPTRNSQFKRLKKKKKSSMAKDRRKKVTLNNW